jgi:predicted ATPase
MDNFEHLLDGVGIVSEMLQAAAGIKILATSRERLNLQSETILHVGGMTFPDQADLENTGTYDAITLFIQSASKVRPGFDPSPDQLGEIAHICQLVGGMPLAIELAAAWLHILKVDEITDELKKDLDILATEVRDTPRRHRSIRAVFDHSWSLLDHDERETFTHLSVFRGGFTRQAAQKVTGASLRLLAGLVDKSFLSHDPDSGRLEVHELLRQYAQDYLEKMTEISSSVHEAHAYHYATFMQDHWENLKGSQQMRALAEIEADMENVRAAWRYYLDQGNAQQLWKFIYGIWHVYWIRWWNHPGMELFAEAGRMLQGEDDDETVALRALAMSFQSYFMGWLGFAEDGYEINNQSVAILEQLNFPMALTFAYYSLGLNAYFLNRFAEEAQGLYKMVEIATELDDKWLLATVLFGPSMVALIQGNYDEARRMAESNLELFEEIGNMIGPTMPLIVLGYAALARGELEDARGFYLRCLKISRETGFPYGIQMATKYLCKVTLSLSDHVEAEKYLFQSLKITKEIGYVRDIVNLIYEYARLHVARGNPERAVELLVLVIRHPASQHHRMIEGRTRDSAKSLLAELENDLSQETYTAALARGRVLDLDEVIEELSPRLAMARRNDR